MSVSRWASLDGTLTDPTHEQGVHMSPHSKTRLSHRTAAIALGLLATLALATPAFARPGGNEGGNSAAAAACEDGGYADWTDAAGNAFPNEGACVSYAARGGMLKAVEVNPFSVSYRPSGADGFVATITGSGLAPFSGVDFILTWGGDPQFFDSIADASGEVTFDVSGACTSAGSPLTAVGAAGTPLGGEHTEYPLPLPDAICPPPG
jgi:hypothetical protein